MDKKRKVARVTNNCGRTMKAKVVINNGQAFSFRWRLGSYDRTVTC